MTTYARNERMKKACYIVISAFFIITSSHAQTAPSSLLWEIRGNGLQQPSYIFGTFHILCKQDFTISGILKDKIITSKQFYSELAMNDPGLQMQLAMKMMMPDKTLQSLMTDSDYQKVSNRFQTIVGMPMVTFNNFKPFVALSLLAMNSISCTDKVQPESLFTELATQNHLPIFGLETIDDQVNAIDKEPLDSQMNSLRQTALNFDSVKNIMANMVSVYKLRDIDSLYSFMKNAGASDDFEMEMIIKRNRNWIPLIKKAVAEKPTFIAVGAGHLGGKDGVINLLRKEGYRVTPAMY